MVDQQELSTFLRGGFYRGLTRVHRCTDPLDRGSGVHLETVAGSRPIGNPIDLQVLVEVLDDFMKIRHAASFCG